MAGTNFAATIIPAPSNPPSQWVAPTLSDTTADPAGPFTVFRVSVTGAVKVQCAGGAAYTFSNLAVGEQIPGLFTRIWSTGTTATIDCGVN